VPFVFMDGNKYVRTMLPIHSLLGKAPLVLNEVPYHRKPHLMFGKIGFILLQ
jgi:hypothetical protein